MNNQMRSTYKLIFKYIACLSIFLVVLALTSCSSTARVAGPACAVDMGMRVTINVTDVKPQVVTDQLAVHPDCAITLSPFVRKHVTLHVEDATVNEVLAILCQKIGCKYVFNEDHLAIRLYTIIDKWQDSKLENFNKNIEERNKVLQNRLPEGMSFENVPLSSVLEEISRASGLTIKAWKDEGDRQVTMDVSDMTVDEALKSIVLSVDGEGAVLIKMWGFNTSYGQHWLWGYPPP